MGRIRHLINTVIGRREDTGGGKPTSQSLITDNRGELGQSSEIDDIFTEGVRRFQEGNLDAAEAAFKSVLKRQSESVGALHLLGVVNSRRGEFGKAKSLIGQALAINPDLPELLVDMGNVHRADGDLETAASFFSKALLAAPDDAESNRSWAYFQLESGNRQVAIEHLLIALEQDPENLQDRVNLAKALAEENIHQEAVPHFMQVIKSAPELALAHRLLANSLAQCRELDSAVRHYEKAISLDPNDYASRNDVGILLHHLGALPAAIKNLQAAAEIKPDFSGVYVNLGNVFKSQKKLVEARRYYEKALELNPDDTSALNNLGTVLKDLGHVAEGIQHFRCAMALRDGFMEAESSLLLSLQYLNDVSLDELKTAHLDWVARWVGDRALSGAAFSNTRDPDRLLRVGYLSPDFHTHPVGLFLEPVLAEHDRSEFIVICYHDQIVGDEVTDRLRALADEWRMVAGLDNERLEELIRNDKIDLLVDLAGHTANNRMLMLARRVAPVQLTWIGYLHSTGLSRMDYLLADEVSIPTSTRQWFSEDVVRLPESFLCYGAPANSPEIAEPPSLTAGFITFACFNNLAKITDEIVGLWAEILERVNNARLVIKNQAFHDTEFCEEYSNKLSSLGLPASRVSLKDHSPRMEYFSSYNEVDILLDPFPFSGGTISCDALWMGVPVVTLAGDRMASRTSASVLCAIGLDELVVDTRESYVRKAVDLATDTDRLRRLRKDMRSRFSRSALGSPKEFCRNLESAYRKMWANWRPD